MIIANITTYRGQCNDAEHYYCHYKEVAEKTPKQHYNGGKHIELLRVITDQEEVDYMIKKDRFSCFEIGVETNRFNSIDQIHQLLIKNFGDETIITYYEFEIFAEMLYWIHGVNHTYKMFGKVWTHMPTSLYKDLLPEDVNTIQIVCDDCGHKYTFDEVLKKEYDWGGRVIVEFCRSRDMDETCCKYFTLKWNIVI